MRTPPGCMPPCEMMKASFLCFRQHASNMPTTTNITPQPPSCRHQQLESGCWAKPLACPLAPQPGCSGWVTVVHNVQELDEYRSLPDDLVSSAKRWTEWMALERPEDEPLPGMQLKSG